MILGDWSEHIDIIVQEVVVPRLANLPMESAEGISGILRLFHAWSTSSTSVQFLGKEGILPRIADCLTPPKTKPEVKLFILEIIKNVVCSISSRSF